MRKISIQAVIFDMDGLMLDSQRIATEAYPREANDEMRALAYAVVPDLVAAKDVILDLIDEQ
jgi:beta-phosphoglucomutase-like phosphatase (HAD superfamily)